MPLAFPSVGIQNLDMRLNRSVAVSSSPYSFEQQAYEHQGARWECEVTLPPLTHSEAKAVQAFIVGLKGRSGTFTFGSPLHTSTATSTTSGTTAIRSETLTTTAGSSAVGAGEYFQLGDYLYMTTAAKSAGAGTLEFQPPLRAEISTGTALDFTLPKSLWRLASNDTGWAVDTASIYGFTFAFVEAL
jgi:hypothetical protein